MDIGWLQDFLTLAETGNFTRAAAQRNVSQAAFSRRIQALEQWLGAPLIDRTSNPVTLTAEGERFHGEAGETLARLLDTRAALRNPGYRGQAQIRLALTHVLSHTRFAGWWQQWSAGSALSVSAKVGNINDIVADFVSGGVDVMVCHRGEQLPVVLDPEQFVAHILETDCLRPYVAADHAAHPRFQLPGTPQAPVPLLMYSEGGYFARLVGIIIEQAPTRLHGAHVVETDTSDALCDFVAAGQGIAWLPDLAASGQLGAKWGVNSGDRIVALAEPGWAMPLQITAYTRRHGRSAAAEAIWRRIAPPD